MSEKWIVQTQQVIRSEDDRVKYSENTHWGADWEFDSKEEALEEHEERNSPTRVVKVVAEDEPHEGWVER